MTIKSQNPVEVAIQVGVAAVLLVACGPPQVKALSNTSSLSAALPTVVMQLGDSWDDVIKNSTYPLGPLAMKAGTGIIAPHKFIYRDSGHYMATEAWYMGVGVNIEGEPKKIADIAIGLYSGTANSEETWKGYVALSN